ncbi:ABC transporter ATP-binding protein [Herbiconiux sp. L3-i23]|uniref:ABC transporter ATP-binding protein n=1 Tax=Herbiconiux sp. L3-i23 TaxID=2905871 RepID=UPI002069123C|nr:ABC transporter ATP-binding protein [Herbiconiux sp. L3-i23]BDI21866.1 ABC transporter ATP-binding protein [Herbiconiux sp. L3-i23]
MSLLEIDDLRITVGNRVLVDGVSLRVEAGEAVGVAGESGSGKTLTVQTALGFLPGGAKATGEVRLDGVDVLTMKGESLRAIRGGTVAMVFQDPMTSLHPMLTIGTQLTEHMRTHLKLSRKAAESRAVEMLELVRIPDARGALSAYPHRFSGGMRQRIAIASALACEPRLLIADEITTALDVTVQAGILELLERLRVENDMAIVAITHDLGVMNVVSERLYVMYAGRVAEHGTTRDVLDRTRHPYSKALLDALPEAGRTGQPLIPIPGEPATPDKRPAGCAFHTRCAFAQESCRTVVPPRIVIEPGHDIACPPDPFAPDRVLLEERV